VSAALAGGGYAAAGALSWEVPARFATGAGLALGAGAAKELFDRGPTSDEEIALG